LLVRLHPILAIRREEEDDGYAQAVVQSVQTAEALLGLGLACV